MRVCMWQPCARHFLLTLYEFLWIFHQNSDNSIASFRFALNIMGACWFRYGKLMQWVCWAFARHMDQHAKAAQKYVCSLWICCRWKMISVVVQTIFNSHKRRPCRLMKSFFFLLVFFPSFPLSNTQKHSSFWYSEIGPYQAMPTVALNAAPLDKGGSEPHLFRSLNRKVQLTETNTLLPFFFLLSLSPFCLYYFPCIHRLMYFLVSLITMLVVFGLSVFMAYYSIQMDVFLCVCVSTVRHCFYHGSM